MEKITYNGVEIELTELQLSTKDCSLLVSFQCNGSRYMNKKRTRLSASQAEQDAIRLSLIEWAHTIIDDNTKKAKKKKS